MTPDQLRAWRERQGATQKAAAAWYGCTERSWQRYELGERRIPRPLAAIITRAGSLARITTKDP